MSIYLNDNMFIFITVFLIAMMFKNDKITLLKLNMFAF